MSYLPCKLPEFQQHRTWLKKEKKENAENGAIQCTIISSISERSSEIQMNHFIPYMTADVNYANKIRLRCFFWETFCFYQY